MNYFYTEIDCYDLYSKEKINKNEFLETSEMSTIVTEDGKIVDPSFNIGKMDILKNGNDKIYFISKSLNRKHKILNIEEVFFDISNIISVSIGDVFLEVDSQTDIEFEAVEVLGDFKLIYFKGEKRFVTIIKNQKLIYANYFDVEKTKNQKVFILKLHDMLNHGLVFGIKDNKFQKYLIYLDNYELNLKPEFIPFVFLDCFIAGNFKYAISLLDECVSCGENELISFLPKCDRYIAISNSEYLLINKNTPKGICKFELKDNKITNIIL